MTTLSEIQIECPICSRFFKTEVVTSTNQVGQCTDLKPIVCGVFPYPFFIHTCPSCGFSGYEDDMKQRYNATFKEKVRITLPQRIVGKKITGSEKYMLAAWCAENLKCKKNEIADLYLRAAWCAQEEADEEKEMEARKRAVLFFEKALTSKDVPDEERALVTYLIGELKRRLGEIKEASNWFDKVKEEIKDPKKQAWILAAAKQQKKNPSQNLP